MVSQYHHIDHIIHIYIYIHLIRLMAENISPVEIGRSYHFPGFQSKSFIDMQVSAINNRRQDDRVSYRNHQPNPADL